jgi:hypothetical protein
VIDALGPAVGVPVGIIVGAFVGEAVGSCSRCRSGFGCQLLLVCYNG